MPLLNFLLSNIFKHFLYIISIMSPLYFLLNYNCSILNTI
uniref:Uncharacterized protein n=1 Tax=Bacteriophage sp. TaxID=38018 RepID=A0A8D9UHW6_9VIRU|nr:MAG TPA: hypothetical protein [Bacteriophage sp.]